MGCGLRRGKSPLSDTNLQILGKSTIDAIASIRLLFPEVLHNRLFLVGGSVRDQLIGQPIQDVDLVTDLSAEQLEGLSFRRVQGKTTDPIYFKSHPTFGKIEITLLADDQSLEDDLLRRDFSCNAVGMALDGTIVDPLGGQDDIKNKILVPCSDESISNDPIRIFRAFRFESNGWSLSPELVNEIKDSCWDYRLSTIPIERFSREMLKAMECTQPDIFFSRMIALGVGKCYLPEIFKMQNIPAGPAKYHGEDTVFSHSLDVLRRMAVMTNDPTARLAAFFHDLGKLATPMDQLPRHIGHDHAGEGLARKISQRIRLPSCETKAIVAANSLHLIGGNWSELRETTKLILAERANKAGIAEYFSFLVQADRNLGTCLVGWDDVLAVSKMNCRELGIDNSVLSSMSENERKSFLVQLRAKKLNCTKS